MINSLLMSFDGTKIWYLFELHKKKVKKFTLYGKKYI